MKKFLLFLGVALCATFSVNEASAQIKAGEGQVSIALESNNLKSRASEFEALRNNYAYREEYF